MTNPFAVVIGAAPGIDLELATIGSGRPPLFISAGWTCGRNRAQSGRRREWRSVAFPTLEALAIGVQGKRCLWRAA
jgi:hypothetical protein